MKILYLVKQEEAETARKMEAKLLALSEESGILFAGVSVTPEGPNVPAVFNIWIGCSRDVDEKMIPLLVEVVLKDEIKTGVNLKIEAHRGVVRSSS